MVKTNTAVSTITDMCNENRHNHAPYTPEELEKQELRLMCKLRAIVDITEKPSQIVSTELAQIASENVHNVKNLKKNIYIERKKFLSRN